MRANRDVLRVKVSSILRAIQEANDIKTHLQREVSDLQNNIKPTLDLLQRKAAMKAERVEITQRDTPYHNTQCLQCAAICHQNCQLDLTIKVGDNIFRGCQIMKNDVCTNCKHGYREHVHVKFIFERNVIEESLLSWSEQRELRQASNVERQKQIIIRQFSCRIQDIERNVLTFKNDLATALRQLKQLCPHYDYKMELNCAIKLLEEEELVGSKTHDPKELQSLKTYFTDLIEKFDQAFQ